MNVADLKASDLVTAYDGDEFCVEEVWYLSFSHRRCTNFARWLVESDMWRRKGAVCTVHAKKRLVAERARRRLPRPRP